MKKIFAIALVICIVTSTFCLTTVASDLSVSDVAFGLNAVKSDGSAVVDFLNEDYIMLVIAILGLVATIVSVVLIAIDRRKETKANKEKESDNNSKTEK